MPLPDKPRTVQCLCCGSHTLYERGAGEMCDRCLWVDGSAGDVYGQPVPARFQHAAPPMPSSTGHAGALPRPDQFSGSLLGQCLGDALGFAVEGYPPDACARYVDRALRLQPATPRGRGEFPFGQYTDDSQLARELLQSIAACDGFEPADYARRIAALFAEGRVVGHGQATEAAARRLQAGVPWEEAGTPRPAAGNGSAMRAGPIGLLYFADPAALVRAAHDQGRITHQDPRCSAGAVAIAGSVALALQTSEINAGAFIDQLNRWVTPLDQSVGAAVSRLTAWLHLPPEAAVVPIAALGTDPPVRGGREGISPFVTSSVLWSLYAFLRTPDDYWTAICTAIAVGGDVDTTAAMAGAISGAHVGLAALPGDLLALLQDRGSWRRDDLHDLAQRCYQLAVRLNR